MLKGAGVCGAVGLAVAWSSLDAIGLGVGLVQAQIRDTGEITPDTPTGSRLLQLLLAGRRATGDLPLPEASVPAADRAALPPSFPNSSSPIPSASTPASAGPAGPHATGSVAPNIADPAPAAGPSAAEVSTPPATTSTTVTPVTGDPSAPSKTPRRASEAEIRARRAAAARAILSVPDRTNVVPAAGPLQPILGPELERDPVEQPIVPSEAWQEWVLAVTLNHREVSAGTLFALEPGTNRLAVVLDQLRLWRVRFDPAKVITLQGEPFYPLDAIPGAEFATDFAQLTIQLVLPGASFEVYALDTQPEPAPPPRTGWGGFVDYDVLMLAGQAAPERVDGLVEVGAFGEPGVLTTSARLQELTSDPEVTRLETRLSKDFPDRRATLRLGDSLTAGGAFGAPVRFGGVQYATSFATDPSFVTFPTPAIGGLADQQSLVDVFVDNLQRARGEVPAGPFALRNLPVMTGAGEVQLKVTDLLGRERIVTQPYYVSTQLLRAGLHDFSYELGFERRDYTQASFDYGDVLAIGTHRYGVTDALTGEVHAELQAEQQSLVAGGSLLLATYGVVSGGVGGSHGGQDIGVLGQLGYEYAGASWSIGARTRYTSQGFRQLGFDDGDVQRVDQLSFGLDLGPAGRLGMLLLNEDRFKDDDRRLIAGSWSMPFGPGSLIVGAGSTIEPERDVTFSAAYALPLGQNRTIVAEARLDDDRQTGRVQFRQSRGASDLGLDYRLGAEIGDGTSLDARFSYQARYAGVDLDLERFNGHNNVRFGVNGSLALVDGAVQASRRLGNAFGLVQVPGFPNVRVYVDNREAGRTDDGGSLLLPALRPYQPNQVRLELDDVPLEAAVGSSRAVAVPYERSGVSITFDVVQSRQATAILRLPSGRPVPAATELASTDGKVTAIVGRNGFTQVTGDIGQGIEITSGGRSEPLICTLPVPLADELLPDLGEVRCR